MRGKNSRRWGMLIGASVLAAAPAFAQVAPGTPRTAQPNIPQAAAPKGPDLAIRSVQLAGLQGRRARINVFGAQTGSNRHQDKVTIFWVEGARRTQLSQVNASFTSSRTGFLNEIAVDLPAQRGNGHLEIVAGVQAADPKWDNNVKTLELGGGDLKFNNRPEIEMLSGGNPNRKLKFEVLNQGPGAIGGNCKVVVEVNGRKVQEKTLRALRAGDKETIVVPFHQTGDAKPLEAKIVCGDDPVANNNTTTSRIR